MKSPGSTAPATPAAQPAYREAFERGFDYLLLAQYPNGGWPQFFPLIAGYYTHITYNDDAMAGVLGVLRDAHLAKAGDVKTLRVSHL